MNKEPKKFTVDELLEDAQLSILDCGDSEKDKWEAIIDFLLMYKHAEQHSEFLWSNQIDTVELEDNIEWDTNLKENNDD